MKRAPRRGRVLPLAGLLAVAALALGCRVGGAFTAEELAEVAVVSGGDLHLFTPPATLFPDGKAKPLLSFAPVSAAEEMAVAIGVRDDDYYQVRAVQLQSPAFRGAYRLRVNDTPLRLPIYFGYSSLIPYNRIWGEVRLKPGRHTLRFSRDLESVPFPMVLESLWLIPGRERSWLTEAEWLIPGAAGERLRPALGWRSLSGFGEMVFPAQGPGDTLSLPLPEAPAGTTHLAVVLVGGSDRGIAEVSAGGGTFSPPVDTYAPAGGLATKTLVFPAAPGAQMSLTVRCAGKQDRAGGYALGVDGVAFGIDHTYEAEWLVWRGPWAGGPVLRDTAAGRATDRGYLGLTCNDPTQPVEIDLPVPWTGRFRLEMRIAPDPSSGKLQAQFDETLLPEVFDANGEKYIWPQEWVQAGEVALASGDHRLRIWCRDKDPRRRVLRLEAIRFVPLPG